MPHAAPGFPEGAKKKLSKLRTVPCRKVNATDVNCYHVRMRTLVITIALLSSVGAGAANSCVKHCKNQARVCKNRCADRIRDLIDRHECKVKCREREDACRAHC
jgi:hypothetical protein